MNPQSTLPLADIQSWPLFSQKDGSYNYLVGSMSADHYLVVDERRLPLIMRIIHRLQQGATPDAIESELAAENLRIDIHAFVQQLARYGLLEESPEETEEQEKKTPFYSQLNVLSWDVFSIPLDGFWPRLLRLSRYYRYLLLSLVLMTSLFIIGEALWGGQHFTLTRLIQIRRHLSLPLFILTYLTIPLLIIPLHELSHALLATEKGVFPKRITLRLYMMVLPFFSLQLPGLYTLPLKRRLLTIAAGPMMNLLLGNLALLISLPGLTTPTAWQAFLLAFAAINYATFIFNLTPFLPLDGYYILSQALFKDLDIRSKAWASARRWIQKRDRGLHPAHGALVAVDSAFLVTLLYLGVNQLNHYILHWTKGASVQFIHQMNPHLITPALIVIDIIIVGFAIYRLSTLMGIRQAIQRTT